MQITLLQIKLILICRIATFAKFRYSKNLQLARYTKGMFYLQVCVVLIFWLHYIKFPPEKRKNRKKGYTAQKI